jgi:hypothetical protein
MWDLVYSKNQLRAYSAAALGTELWTSAQASGNRDQVGTVEKFTTPIVADGHVLVGTASALVVYGLSSVAPAIISSAPPANGGAGVNYSFNYTATGFPIPTFSVTAGALPTGLTLTSAGALSGTPSAPGAYTGTVTASNGVSPVATQNFSIVISNTYTFWATSQEGLTGNQALQTAVVSPDGITNLMKYALGLNPFVTYNPGNPNLPVVRVQDFSGTKYLTLTFTGVATDVTYTVQASSDLTGAWSNVYTYNGVPAPGTVVVQDTQPIPTTNPTKRFMRLQVSP